MNSTKLYFVNLAFWLLPSRFHRTKQRMLRWAGAEVGRNVRIMSGVRIMTSGRLQIGDDSYLGEDLLVAGGNAPIAIGAAVDIGPRVTLVAGTHEIENGRSKAAGRGYSLPIVIEDGAWLGACSTVLGGVRIGRASMIAAAALVRTDVPAGALVAGVPASVIRLARSIQ